MSNIRNVFIWGMFAIILSNGCCQKPSTASHIERIFIPRIYNLTDITRILLNARESFLALKVFEDETDVRKKFEFAQNYANYLWELLNSIQTKNFDVHQIFEEESLFLKNNKSREYAKNVNNSELKSLIDNFQYGAERVLIPFYNSTDLDYLGVPEFLALEETEIEDFAKEKLKLAKSSVGYFFLEIFATLVGLSWGLISTVLYNGDGMNNQM